MSKYLKNPLIVFLLISGLCTVSLMVVLFSDLLASRGLQIEMPETPVAENPGAAWRVFLTGDTGNIRRQSLTFLDAQFRQDSQHSTVILMGDNIYDRGLVAEGHALRSQAVERLNKQLNVFSQIAGLQTIFVPGNHDWDNSGPDGLDSVRRQQAAVEKELGQGSFVPVSGCPGPELVEIGPGIASLVILDSEWWLRNEHVKPNQKSDGCPSWDEQGVANRLADLLNKAKAPVIYAQHHPLYSTGPHSRLDVCHRNQDFGCERYQHLRQSILKVLLTRPPLVCASGHDHSLQVMRPDPACSTFLVSGATTSITSVQPDAGTLFAAKEFGLMRIDFMPDGRRILQVIGESETNVKGKQLFSTDL